MEENKIPRRNVESLNTIIELEFNNLLTKVENLGADILLTDAVTLLKKAKDKVSDFIEK